MPSEPVMVLLAIGGGLLLTSMMATMMDDPSDEAIYVAVGTGGVGLVFWSAAGIVALVED